MFMLMLFIIVLIVFFAFLNQGERLVEKGPSILFFSSEEDDDMKIVAGISDLEAINELPNGSQNNFKEKIEELKNSGEIGKAKTLADSLAYRAVHFNEYLGETSRKTCTQMRMMYCFAVKNLLENEIENKIVSETAVSTFLENLENNDIFLFNKLKVSGAFSMYTLLSRNPRTKVREYGEAFAELCYQENDEEYIKKGTDLFVEYTELARKELKEANF